MVMRVTNLAERESAVFGKRHPPGDLLAGIKAWVTHLSDLSQSITAAKYTPIMEDYDPVRPCKAVSGPREGGQICN